MVRAILEASSEPCVLFIAFESPVDAVPVQTESR